MWFLRTYFPFDAAMCSAFMPNLSHMFAVLWHLDRYNCSCLVEPFVQADTSSLACPFDLHLGPQSLLRSRILLPLALSITSMRCP